MENRSIHNRSTALHSRIQSITLEACRTPLRRPATADRIVSHSLASRAFNPLYYMSMRFLSPVIFCSLACMSPAQDTSVKVTYSTRAARASVVVRELGHLANLDLQTSPQTESEILIIAVKARPLTEVMDRIATVTSSQWKQEGSAFRLVPNSKMRNQEDRVARTKLVAKITKGIHDLEANANKRLAELEKSISAQNAPKVKDTKSNENTSNAPGVPSPASFLRSRISLTSQFALISLIKGLDPTVLAQIGPDDRFVFSTEPNRMQRSLGGDAADIIKDFIQTHNDQISNLPPMPSPDLTGMDSAQITYFQNLRRRRSQKLDDVAKAVLVATSQDRSNDGRISFNLRLYDSKGGVGFVSTANLPNAEAKNGGSDDGDPPGDAKAASPPAKTTPIEYTAESKALIEATSEKDSDSFRFNLSPELRRKLSLPNLYDPLSFADTDEILAYSKSIGKPLVANLPDDYGGLGAQEESTLEAVADEIKDGNVIVSMPDSEYLVIQPADPPNSRAIRADRLALATLMRAVDEKGVPTLDDFVSFALSSPSPDLGGFVDQYFNFLIPGQGGHMFEFGKSSNWDMLRFYGQLSSESRSILSHGGKLPFGSLTSAQRSEVEQLMYGASSELTIDDPQKTEDVFTPDWLRRGGNFLGIDYRGEPTEVAPTGLPSEGYLDLKVRKESFAQPVDIGGSGYIACLGVLGPEEMAMIKLSRDAKDTTRIAPVLSKIRIGEQSLLSFTFHVAPQIVIQQGLIDHYLPPNGTIVSEANLPSDFMKEVSDLMEALKKADFEAQDGAIGTNGKIHP